MIHGGEINLNLITKIWEREYVPEEWRSVLSVPYIRREISWDA
jgi:hypothetical protein